MILLDTNVISEMMKASPDPRVQAWLDHQDADTVFVSTVTVAELLFGVSLLPEGRRKRELNDMVEAMLGLFRDRRLAFDDMAARSYAYLAVRARVGGKGFPTPDGYIAAIAASRGFAIATRDVAPFQAAGLDVINPWTA